MQHGFSGTLPLPRAVWAGSSLRRECSNGGTIRTTVALRSPPGGPQPPAPGRDHPAAWPGGAPLPLLQCHSFWGGTTFAPAAQPTAGGARSLGGMAGGFSGAIPTAPAAGVCLHRGRHGHARGSCRHQQLRRIGKGQGLHRAAFPPAPGYLSQSDIIFSLAPLCLGFLWAQCMVWAKSRASLPPESSVRPAGHQAPALAGVQGLVWLVPYSLPHCPWTRWDSSLPSPDMRGGGRG